MVQQQMEVKYVEKKQIQKWHPKKSQSQTGNSKIDQFSLDPQAKKQTIELLSHGVVTHVLSGTATLCLSDSLLPQQEYDLNFPTGSVWEIDFSNL